ncbi:MAG TPA: hypothetical protein VJ654_07240 [Noviherbaspirillum sp.]|nr:hypothetical protein [Noviherbaspirillum sp.]
MDLILIEILLWIGLLFFFWALKEGLGNVESDIESFGLLQNARNSMLRGEKLRTYRPERVVEPIGSYRETQIYRYAVIQGRVYQFDRICPPGSDMSLDEEECYLEPGLIYQACPSQRLPT